MIMLLLSLLLSAQSDTSVDQHPAMSIDDRTRIAEAFRVALELQEDLWEGWNEVPFALLLVTPEQEFLIRHPSPSSDFTAIGYDSLLQSTVYVRQRVFPPNLRACFPAVGNISTIVIGQPDGTGQSSTFWVLTALHEHFHQLQNAQPDFYDAVNALGLAGADKTGSWMLNYPFPYDSTEISVYLANLGEGLLRTVEAIETPAFAEELTRYLERRLHLKDVLSEKDYKYLSFQLWQEGVARYTELWMAEAAAREYTPSVQFQSLKDFVPFGAAADSLYRRIRKQLTDLDLPSRRREALYPLGAAEAILLDAVRPSWRGRYFEEKFFLERFYE